MYDIGTQMYSERLIDHFRNPRNVGELGPPAVTIEVSNPICGDILRLSVRFEGDRASEVAYKTRGCTASIAAGSALTELVVGRTRAELGSIRPADIEAAVGGLSSESKHAAVLCADGLKTLLKTPLLGTQVQGKPEEP
jgi:nitrogen fixation NifU-like protein